MELAVPAKAILVVEDNENDAALMKLMFRRARVLNPVLSVPSVHDTLCYLKGEGMYADRSRFPFPTLLFVDLHLGDGSGFDVLRWIRENRARSPVGVVVLSGSDVTAFKKAYELGAHSFLVKPLSFEDFQSTVTLLRGLKLTPHIDGYLLELE